MSETSIQSIENKQRRINWWLRHHTDYQVTIHLYSVYGCIDIVIEHNGEHIKSWIGDTLEKRLDEVIMFLNIDEYGRSKERE